MGKIIEIGRSVIPACDVPIQKLEEIVRETADIEKISAYKVGFFLGLRYGLPETVDTIREYTKKPVIYDHQKAGRDIPDTGEIFAEACMDAGINAVILFPFAGPQTETTWINACRSKGLGVIIGGVMTHEKFKKSEGGFLEDEAVYDIYRIAADNGVNDFVVPGNKPDEIIKIKAILEGKGLQPVLYSPGLIAQGGNITESAKAAGNNWHAIVGRALYEAKDIKQAALELVSRL